MDIFIEQIIEAKPDLRANVLKISVIASMVLFCGLLLLAAVAFMGSISFIAAAAILGVIWLGVHFFKGLTVEYEYILTNKDLDIDKITGRRNRKRLITLNLANAESFNICKEEVSFNADVTVSAHDNTYLNMWYLIVKHDSLGRVILLFNPNDRFAVKLNKALPGNTRNNNINMEKEF
ncbi:MAG: hypothetical protein FWF94_04305 [Oscillospiraceae bacterium]|nr:hypothetical protein [Oscillospiraceae bacterium]